MWVKVPSAATSVVCSACLAAAIALPAADMAADGSSFRITSRPSVSPRNAGILDCGPWMREKPDDGNSCRRNPGNVGLEGGAG